MVCSFCVCTSPCKFTLENKILPEPKKLNSLFIVLINVDEIRLYPQITVINYSWCCLPFSRSYGAHVRNNDEQHRRKWKKRENDSERDRQKKERSQKWWWSLSFQCRCYIWRISNKWYCCYYQITVVSATVLSAALAVIGSTSLSR